MKFLSLFVNIIGVMFILFANVFSHSNHSYNTKSIQNCRHDSLLYATLNVNGDTSDQLIPYVRRDQHILIETQTFLDIVGGQYCPLWQNYGLTVQYGKIISFVAIHYQQGFVACNMVEMLPPAEIVNNTVMAPINFLAQAINGTVNFVDTEQRLEISTTEPAEIGNIVPEAKNLADALSHKNYFIRQGYINLANAIEFYAAGYQPDCNGNNASFPYLVIQTPPCPGVPYVFSIPLFYTMRPD